MTKKRKQNQKRTKVVAAELCAWQRRNGFTNAQAAQFIGAPERTYRDWKAGKHRPRGFALTQLLAKISNTRDEPRGQNTSKLSP